MYWAETRLNNEKSRAFVVNKYGNVKRRGKLPSYLLGERTNVSHHNWIIFSGEFPENNTPSLLLHNGAVQQYVESWKRIERETKISFRFLPVEREFQIFDVGGANWSAPISVKKKNSFIIKQKHSLSAKRDKLESFR